MALVGLTTAAVIGGSVVLPGVAGAAAADVTVTTSNPLVAHSTQDVGVGEIKLVENAAGDIPVGDVCIELLGGTATWDGATDPVVADNNATATTNTPDVLSPVRAGFKVGAASAGSAATYTITGLKLDTSGTPGPVLAEVGNCTGNNDQFEASIKVAYIGAVDRISGADRYVTAQEISQEFPCVNNNHVVVARGDNFPDALSASFLAGKRNSPILLVQQNAVPQATYDALKDLGASNVTIIGGEGAISAAVATALDARAAHPTCGGAASGTLTVTRIGGTDRYETAKLVGAAGAALANPVAGAGTLGTVGNNAVDCAGAKKKTAIVASGENFPDALAAGGLAWAGAPATCGNESAFPLLLTLRDSLPTFTSSAIADLGIEQVILLGGTTAVSSAVETALDGLANVSVVRVSGATRQATAVELTKRILGADAPAGLDWTGGSTRRFLVSRPDTFPDALVAGPLAGKDTAPLFLAESTIQLGATATAGITAYPNGDFFHRGTLLGGVQALAPSVQPQVGAAIANQAN